MGFLKAFTSDDETMRRVAILQEQRDALLEAARDALGYLPKDIPTRRQLEAAIAKATENKPQ